MAYIKLFLIASLLVMTTFATSASSSSSSSQQLQCPTIVGVSHFACSSLDNSPVCVTYNNGTTKDFQNSCFACAADKSSIKYYTNGTCPAPAKASSASTTQQMQCPTIVGVSHFACSSLDDSPVCVTYNNGTTKDFQNSCFACAADKTSIKYYTNGTCPAPAKASSPSTSQQMQCPTIVGVSHFACSSLDNSPVCVTYNNGTTKDFQNSCFACAADKASIKYYANGTCPAAPAATAAPTPAAAANASQQHQQCPVIRLGVSHYACSSADNSPVCVAYNNATTKTFQNSCFGCAADRDSISYFTAGACPVAKQQCPTIVGVSHLACSSLDKSPVCVKYTNGTSATFENSCFGCANRAQISYFTAGAC